MRVASSPRARRPRGGARSGRRPQHGGGEALSRLNLEDQNQEILRWLTEEMQHSRSLLENSRQLHETELVEARREIGKVKRAAQLLLRAAHRKGQDRAAQAEARAEEERRRRRRDREKMERLVRSQSTRAEATGGMRCRNIGEGRPWDDLQEDTTTTDTSLSFSDASGLTSILDDLAQEAYQYSCC